MEPNSPPQEPQQPQGAGAPPPSYDQPVAYDQFGNPLYARPPEQSQFVHVTRSIQPIAQSIPPEIKALHDESHRKYPQLNLSAEEYIVSNVTRHPIGIIKIWAIAFALVAAFMGLLIGFFMNGGSSTVGSFGNNGFALIAFVVITGLTMLVVLGALAATYVYNNNTFFLTNESVIQEIQSSLFSKREQTVSLSNIEDASYRQGGILQSLLDFGTIRLSTEGDETTYRFSYVKSPKRQIAILNNAVECFKNGRPIPLPYQDQPS